MIPNHLPFSTLIQPRGTTHKPRYQEPVNIFKFLFLANILFCILWLGPSITINIELREHLEWEICLKLIFWEVISTLPFAWKCRSYNLAKYGRQPVLSETISRLLAFCNAVCQDTATSTFQKGVHVQSSLRKFWTPSTWFRKNLLV